MDTAVPVKSPQPFNLTQLPQPTMENQNQFIVVGHPRLVRPTDVVDKRKQYKNLLIGLGVTEMILGVLSCTLSIVALTISNGVPIYIFGHLREEPMLEDPSYASSGIWGGVFIMATGITGISWYCKPTRCLYYATLSMTIAVAIIASGAGYLSAMTVSSNLTSITVTVLYSIVCILLFTAVIVAIWHAISCRTSACLLNNSEESQQNGINYTPLQSPSGIHPNIAAISVAVPSESTNPPNCVS